MAVVINGTTGIDKVQDDSVDIADLSATGSPSSSTYLRGDNSWATVTSGATALDGLSDAKTPATNNLGLGGTALHSLTTGDNNIAIGHEAMYYTTTGYDNVAIGEGTMEANTTGHDNVAVGREALDANTTGNNNVAIGRVALGSNTTANANNALGQSALALNTTGTENNAFGYQALATNSVGSWNTAFGHKALASQTNSEYNIGIGREALKATTTGSLNVAVGANALLDNTTGSRNIAIGKNAMEVNTTGGWNTVVGFYAAQNCTASQNVVVGYKSAQSLTSGEKNVCVGQYAGENITTGSQNVCIGSEAGRGQVTTNSYSLHIARDNSAASNAGVWIYGHSNGACYQGNNSSSWSTSSDERIKKDIVDSPNGLEKINGVNVRNFNYRTPEEITTEGLHGCDAQGLQTGVIAQELATVLPNAVTENDFGLKQVNTDPIFWAMVKAIQELSAKNDALEARITTLEGQEQDMEEMTADEVAAAYVAMGHSVDEVNSSKGADETDDEFAARVARNKEHLVLMKAKKKIDGTTSIWTSESFTAIDAAIAS